MMQIHQKIKIERLISGLSEGKVATALGIPRSTYQYWEKTPPSYEDIRRIAEALGRPKDFFFVTDDDYFIKAEEDLERAGGNKNKRVVPNGHDMATASSNAEDIQAGETTNKYLSLLEKTVVDKDKVIEQKEEDLKAFRTAIEKIAAVDNEVRGLKATVHGLSNKFAEYEPTILGLQEFVIEEISELKKISSAKVRATLRNKTEAFRKKA